MDLGIKGKRAIVTGGGSGIGFQTARQFLEEGGTILAVGSSTRVAMEMELPVTSALVEPDKDGKLIPNPHKMLSDIDKALPNKKIEVMGPPPTSGTITRICSAGSSSTADSESRSEYGFWVEDQTVSAPVSAS